MNLTIYYKDSEKLRDKLKIKFNNRGEQRKLDV